MKIDSRTVGDIHVPDCRGKLTLGNDTQVIISNISGILNGGGKKIVLNLADVPYIDSSGIGELVSADTTVANRGGQLKLLNLTQKVYESLSIETPVCFSGLRQRADYSRELCLTLRESVQ